MTELRLVRRDTPAQLSSDDPEGSGADVPRVGSAPTPSEQLLQRMQLHYLTQDLFRKGLITGEAMDREDRVWSWLLYRRDLEVRRARRQA